MGGENVEVVLKGIEAVNAGDLEALAELVDPDVEWDDSEGFAGLRRVHRGPDEMRAWLAAVLEPWESMHLDVAEISEGTRDRVYLETLMRARGKASGVETEIRVWMVFTVSGGKIATRRLFWAKDEALEAAGLAG